MEANRSVNTAFAMPDTIHVLARGLARSSSTDLACGDLQAILARIGIHRAL